MTDEHARLTAEYDRLLKEFGRHGNQLDAEHLHEAAILHILKRLGPPTAEETADIGIAEDAA